MSHLPFELLQLALAGALAATPDKTSADLGDQSVIVLEGAAGDRQGPTGWLFLPVASGAPDTVQVEQMSPLVDDDRSYLGLITATGVDRSGTLVRQVRVGVKDADLPPGIATARARVQVGDGAAVVMPVEVHTRRSALALFAAVALGALVQVVHRVVRPQVDAITEVRPAIAELERFIARERRRRDPQFSEKIQECETALAKAKRFCGYTTRDARLLAVTEARATLIAALAELATRRDTAQASAQALEPLRLATALPRSLAGQVNAATARLREIGEALAQDDVQTATEALKPGAALHQEIAALAQGLRAWRAEVRPVLMALQTLDAPLPPAPALTTALGEARTRLDAPALANLGAEPIDVVSSADSAAQLVRIAVQMAVDTLLTLLPRVAEELTRQYDQDKNVSKYIKNIKSDADALRALAGQDLADRSAVTCVKAAAAALLTNLCDITDQLRSDHADLAKQHFRDGLPMTGLGVLLCRPIGRGAKLERTPGGVEVEPLDLHAVPSFAPPPPQGAPSALGGAPPVGPLPAEWGFDSTTGPGLAFELPVSVGLVMFGAWAWWGRSWYGTPQQLGEAVGFGLVTNLALSNVIRVYQGWVNGSGVSPAGRLRTSGAGGQGPAATGTTATPPASAPPADTRPSALTPDPDPAREPGLMSEDDLLGAEDPAAAPDPRLEGIAAGRGRASLEGTRKTYHRADVRWADDPDSPDYAHLLPARLDARPFDLSASALEAMCAANSFPLPASGVTLFALRGCQPVDAPDGLLHDRVSLQEAVPDHANLRCTIGVWWRDATGGRLAVFRGSTVPNADFMAGYANGVAKLRNNMRPTGLYQLELGVHQPVGSGPERGVQGAWLQHHAMGVFRTTEDAIFDTRDLVTELSRSDNLHPTGDRADRYCKFSSAGCVTVEGAWDPVGRSHQDPPGGKGWAAFRALAGVTPVVCPRSSVVQPPLGTLFPFLLLTGREARLAATGASLEPRLRYGSEGAAVRALQEVLGFEGERNLDGVFGKNTQMALVKWQHDTLGRVDGILKVGDHGIRW